MNALATVTSRGQVTLPKAIRSYLNTRVIAFEIRDGVVTVNPVKSVGGSLAAYAGSRVSLAEIRKTVWNNVSHEQAKGHSA